ncbi:MAG: enoyl-CoA hydratase/isomerase family protein [Alphaproteobacteria bacterium]|nr:enoyl-CoA hydratase/isomerase family protein [Alphaproteobacteria bacterium]
MTEQEILFGRDGRLAHVLLNRPKALNALTHGMCLAFAAQLREWEGDDRIGAVLIRGAGGKAFCAGGDIRKLYEEGRAGGAYPYRFYGDEYRLNAHIKRFAKPYIAFMDGITMGGGVGFSVHGRRRIVTENTVFAMPETGIGLFPDVGGTHFLSRCPGGIGMYLALTGARMKAADCLHARVADAFVPAARLDELAAALARSALRGDVAEIDAMVATFAGDPGPSELARHRATIDQCFAGDSVEAILGNLERAGTEFAADCARVIRTKSPTSCKIAFRQVRAGANLSMDECMRLEWRVVTRVIRGHDFYEGVRAVIIDKDQKPRWNPARFEDVSDAEIDRYFAPPEEGELPLP